METRAHQHYESRSVASLGGTTDFGSLVAHRGCSVLPEKEVYAAEERHRTQSPNSRDPSLEPKEVNGFVTALEDPSSWSDESAANVASAYGNPHEEIRDHARDPSGYSTIFTQLESVARIANIGSGVPSAESPQILLNNSILVNDSTHRVTVDASDPGVQSSISGLKLSPTYKDGQPIPTGQPTDQFLLQSEVAHGRIPLPDLRVSSSPSRKDASDEEMWQQYLVADDETGPENNLFSENTQATPGLTTKITSPRLVLQGDAHLSEVTPLKPATEKEEHHTINRIQSSSVSLAPEDIAGVTTAASEFGLERNDEFDDDED